MTSGMNGDVDMDLGNNERRMLRAMLSDPSREWTLGQLLSETGWEDQVHVAGAGKKLEEEGLLELSESSSRMVSLGDEGQRHRLLHGGGHHVHPQAHRRWRKGRL